MTIRSILISGGVLLLATSGTVAQSAGQGRAKKTTAGYKKCPGFVDAKKLADIAGEQGNIVEVCLHGALLKQVAHMIFEEHHELSAFLEQLQVVNAVVIKNNANADACRAEMRRLAAQIEDCSWLRLARVRENNSDVRVYVLSTNDGEEICGLTVFVEQNNELVFVNIAGKIDLHLVGDLAETGLPGLSELAGDKWMSELGKKSKKSKNKRTRRSQRDDGRSEGAAGSSR
jgi:hypothetical protein